MLQINHFWKNWKTTICSIFRTFILVSSATLYSGKRQFLRQSRETRSNQLPSSSSPMKGSTMVMRYENRKRGSIAVAINWRVRRGKKSPPVLLPPSRPSTEAHAATLGWNQCDQIGRFLKLLVANCLTKVAQIFGNFLGYCKKHYSVSKNCCGSFLGIVCEIWATFYSNIWSHWMARRRRGLWRQFLLFNRSCQRRVVVVVLLEIALQSTSSSLLFNVASDGWIFIISCCWSSSCCC